MIPQLNTPHPSAVRSRSALLDEVLAGLHGAPKRVEPTWFYDERGSALFEEICRQPEYYLTRTELAIMRASAGEMAAQIGPNAALIEFGSGNGIKTRLLLDHMAQPNCYVPVDISNNQLMDASGEIARDYPELAVCPVCADFTQLFPVPGCALRAPRRVVYFPGSTLGNFEAAEAAQLLQRMRKLAGRRGLLLIGVDLKKEVAVLERAYNDAKGVTAAFNLNVLRHLNRIIDARFNLGAFAHRAVWNEALSRIEMHLVSRADQRVNVGHSLIHFEAGEPLVTEYSHKYTQEAFAELASRAGLRIVRTWMDAGRRFSVQMLETAG